MIVFDNMPVPYETGMTLAALFAREKLELNVSVLVIVNGHVIPRANLADFVLNDGDEVRVAPIIGGGA
jgi:thiamine biosynthesis protein ThiS